MKKSKTLLELAKIGAIGFFALEMMKAMPELRELFQGGFKTEPFLHKCKPLPLIHRCPSCGEYVKAE